MKKFEISKDWAESLFRYSDRMVAARDKYSETKSNPALLNFITSTYALQGFISSLRNTIERSLPATEEGEGKQ